MVGFALLYYFRITCSTTLDDGGKKPGWVCTRFTVSGLKLGDSPDTCIEWLRSNLSPVADPSRDDITDVKRSILLLLRLRNLSGLLLLPRWIIPYFRSMLSK